MNSKEIEDLIKQDKPLVEYFSYLNATEAIIAAAKDNKGNFDHVYII
jgi:hypothetical protein